MCLYLQAAKEENIKILLIDADSTIPNLALMKLSTYWKRQGFTVDFMSLCIPYYPSRIKKHHTIKTSGYIKTYCSVVFCGNAEYVHGDDIEFGGTGVDIEKKLPDSIEREEPDYSIYPENKYSYGFISRGCIRNCSFCFVPKKEGSIRKVATVDSIVRHKAVKFLDNNILALPDHKDILQELVDKKIKSQFNQGLDLRLIDEENSILLSKMNYIGEYVFAFDNWSYKKIIEEKIKLLSWRKEWQLKFFVYVHPSMDISETSKRVEWLRDHKCLPYIMRDISCWSDTRSNFYTDLAAYCNQPAFFKKKTFNEFLLQRHSKGDRAYCSNEIWKRSLSK